MNNITKKVSLDKVSICFSGDSGDGMQLTGTMFSGASASDGNSISTFPDYPAEIRAPKGTISGVSGFQIHIGKEQVHTPGDQYDVLVAMNPAALKANAKNLKQGGTIIVDMDTFDELGLEKAGYMSDDPFKEDGLQHLSIIKPPIETLTKASLADSGLDNKSILRCKNMFALGLSLWLFNKPLKHTEELLRNKFAKKPQLANANIQVLNDGYNYGMNVQATAITSFEVPVSTMAPGHYRRMDGNLAAAWGLIAAAEKANKTLFLGSYPITPATEILQELSARKDLGVKVFQAEDEIAGACSAIGASFAGALGVTTTSGPGLALKGEAIGLAVMTELPLVVINVQRGGPSTGLPTKTEQADLLQALYGRNGESPVPVIAASTPANCFDYAFMAAKIAVEHMTPVILLTDGYLANGSEAWKIPDLTEYPDIKVNEVDPENKEWKPYQRDAETLVRNWVAPGTPNLMHRIGGLEKEIDTGNISYEPENHQEMVLIRQEKVNRIAQVIPQIEVLGEPSADLLIVGWGGTYGHLLSAVEQANREGQKVAYAHFNFICPLPANTEEIFAQYKHILVCELNLGQFAKHLRMEHPQFDYKQFNKVQGLPFTVEEIQNEIAKFIK